MSLWVLFCFDTIIALSTYFRRVWSKVLKYFDALFYVDPEFMNFYSIIALENTPTQTQDKVKRIQAKHAEWVDWFMQITSCSIYPKIYNTENLNVWKYDATELSTVNMYIVWYFSMKTTTTKIEVRHKECESNPRPQ